MAGPGRQRRAPRRPAAIDLSVVLSDGPGAGQTIRALARQRLGERVAELVMVRAWPGGIRSPPPAGGALEVQVVDVAATSTSAALNAGAAVARGRVVLLLSAGDTPEDEDLLARHAEAHEADADVVIGAVRESGDGGDPVAAAWIGTWPDRAPAPPARHLSVARPALQHVDGLDERLPQLDVAVIELAERLAEAGHRCATRPDLIIRGPLLDRRSRLARCTEAGTSARALATLLAERDAPTRELGPRRARVTLRWLEPALRVRAALPHDPGGRTAALVHRAAFARGLGGVPPALERTARGGLGRVDIELRRPPVAVVVPFAGMEEDGAALMDALASVERGPDDEIVVVDNSRTPTLSPRREIRVVRADAEWSSYHARNTGALAVAAPWLLFVDSDCRPAPWILDAYFAPEPPQRAGAVAGGVLPAPGEGGWAARWSADLEVLSQARSLGRESRPYAVTANLLVRREAFERLGGFAEGVRSAGDTEFSWRLQADGWLIEHRPRAAVLHIHRTTVRDLVKQYRRYGAGAGWLDRRYPGALAGWPTVSRAMLAEPLRDIAAGRFELALTRATELLTTAGAWIGALSHNRPSTARGCSAAAAVAFASTYPDADAPDAAARVAALEPDVAVEARRRPLRFAMPRPDVPVGYAEDDAPLDRLDALRWLARQPGGRGALAAAAAEGWAALRALGADAAVARRVADSGAGHLAAADAGPGAATALERVRALLGRPPAAEPAYRRRSST